MNQKHRPTPERRQQHLSATNLVVRQILWEAFKWPSEACINIFILYISHLSMDCFASDSRVSWSCLTVELRNQGRLLSPIKTLDHCSLLQLGLKLLTNIAGDTQLYQRDKMPYSVLPSPEGSTKVLQKLAAATRSSMICWTSYACAQLDTNREIWDRDHRNIDKAQAGDSHEPLVPKDQA